MPVCTYTSICTHTLYYILYICIRDTWLIKHFPFRWPSVTIPIDCHRKKIDSDTCPKVNPNHHKVVPPQWCECWFIIPWQLVRYIYHKSKREIIVMFTNSAIPTGGTFSHQLRHLFLPILISLLRKPIAFICTGPCNQGLALKTPWPRGGPWSSTTVRVCTTLKPEPHWLPSRRRDIYQVTPVVCLRVVQFTCLGNHTFV